MNIINLSNISDGSLLACCRESKAFHCVENTYMEIDKVRFAWRDFLVNSDATAQCVTWVDAWNNFCDYADTEALEYAEHSIKEEFSGELEIEFPESKTSQAYKLFQTNIGRIRLYANGLITQGTENIGFASVFAFDKKSLNLTSSGF